MPTAPIDPGRGGDPDTRHRLARDAGAAPQAASEGAALVRRYLDAMEARDLDTARACLAPGFTMTFPGGVTMTSLEELIAWAAPRYRFVTKTHDGTDALGDVVVCRGTLRGEWPDGTEFSGIRFIDRFELSAGRILRQEVWNDMGEVRP